MKLLIAIALLAQSPLCFASSGMPCEKIEYAQLKDSDKNELIDIYCSAMARSKLNEELRALSAKLFDQQLALGVNRSATRLEMIEKGEAHVSCLRVAESASSMLKKKYKASPPTCN